MIVDLQQIRDGCIPRRPTPQKKALATADLVIALGKAWKGRNRR
jgi:hypothetical protein